MKKIITSIIILCFITGCSTVSIRKVDAKTFQSCYKRFQDHARRHHKILDICEFIGTTTKNAYIERKRTGFFTWNKEVYWIPLKELPNEFKKEIKTLNKEDALNSDSATAKPE